MTPLYEAAVRATLLLGAALIAHALLRGRSAALRHAVLAAGIAAALVVEPATRLMPSTWTLEIVSTPDLRTPAQTAAEETVIATVITAVRDAPATLPTARVIPILWAGGVFAGLSFMALGFLRLVSVTARATPLTDSRWTDLAARTAGELGVARQVSLRVATADEGPSTWGVFRPVILLPVDAADWDDARVRVVLCHELAHIRRGDWIVQVLAEGLRALWWFNPLAWAVCARLQHEGEQACDDIVLHLGVAADDYAAELLQIARSRPRRLATAALSMARISTLERRIAAMLSTSRVRRPVTRRALLSIAALAVTIAVPLAAMRMGAQDGPQPLDVQLFDPTSGVLPGAEVTIESAGSGKRNAVSDANGGVRFEAVSPGEYTLEATIIGFRPLRTPVTLRVARDWTRAITLQVGDLTETVTVAERRPGVTPSAAATPVREPLRVGGNIKTPRKLVHVGPAYPPAMRDAGLEGVVPIEAVIATDGAVTGVRVLSAQVHPEFAKAAIDAVRQWRFSPTLLNGEAVEVRMTIFVAFSLVAN